MKRTATRRAAQGGSDAILSDRIRNQLGTADGHDVPPA